MPLRFTEDEHDRLRKLLSVSHDEESVREEAVRERRHPKFDGTINLGHVFTIITMVIAIAGLWVNSRVTTADHESRIHALEIGQAKMQATEEKLAEGLAQGMVNQKEISIALKYLTDRKP